MNKKWYKFFKSMGNLGEPLGLLGVPLLSIFTPKSSIKSALKTLGWYDLQPKHIAGAGLLIGLLIGTPITVILFVLAGNLGLLTGLLLIYSIAGYIYQIPDDLTFKVRYEYTFFTPLALEVMGLELLRSNNKDTAITKLIDYNLGVISYMIDKYVNQEFRKKNIHPSRLAVFTRWLREVCPSDFFKYYANQLLMLEHPTPEKVNEIIQDAQTRLFNTLESKVESSSMRMSLSILFVFIGSALFAMLISLMGSAFRVNTSWSVGFFVLVLFVFVLPILIYDLLASSMRQYYIIDEVKL